MIDQQIPELSHLLLYCRPGFEADLAAEISELAAQAGVYGYVRTEAGQGYVCYICQQAGGALQLMQRLRFSELVFARQWLACLPPLTDLDTADRITPLLQQLELLPECGELWVETADTNDAKQLATFCRKFTSPCAAALRRAGRLASKRNRRMPRLHLFFLDSRSVYLGISDPANSAADPMGIKRLKFPAAAPSRSTLKLEEAWLTFLSPREREARLQPGMTAVDLGAAPGGWTWQLVKQHFRTTAVDNGPMNAELMDSGLVTHAREDGFRFRPQRPVDWMVCDIADQPSKVAELAALWIAEGWCRHAVFNLKLPMKKRYQALVDARERIATRLQAQPYQLQIKHLYHDREEVSCYLCLQ